MTTKLELTQLLAARNTELVAARERISVLEGELALRPRAGHPAPAPRPAYVRAPYARPAHFEAARAAAMRAGITVKVTA